MSRHRVGHHLTHGCLAMFLIFLTLHVVDRRSLCKNVWGWVGRGFGRLSKVQVCGQRGTIVYRLLTAFFRRTKTLECDMLAQNVADSSSQRMQAFHEIPASNQSGTLSRIATRYHHISYLVQRRSRHDSAISYESWPPRR